MLKQTLLACALFLVSPSPDAFAITYSLDVVQGFRFNPNVHTQVGHLTSLQVGNTSLRQDLTVKDPVTGSNISAVGVLRDYEWRGGSGEPKQISFQVSAANKAAIQALIRGGGLASTPVKIAYTAFDYDVPRKRYFNALRPKDGPLNAFFLVSDNKLHFTVSNDSDPAVPSPQNFVAYIGLIPARGDQFVIYTPAYGRPNTKSWIHNGP